MVRVNVSLYQEVRTCLAGGIGTVGVIGRGLIEKCILILRQRTVHLIRGHMQEFLPFLKAAVRKLPGRLGAVEHHRGSQHIGLNKDLRIADTPIHMALRREVDHPVNVIFRKNPGNRLFIADIRPDKGITRPILHIL